MISIGNITVGGSGKTPMTIYLAGVLLNQGKRVAVVHSGYGRKDKQEYIIRPGYAAEYTVKQVGDEVSMMAKRLPQVGFAVGSDKKRMVKLVDEKLRPDVILIDDGFQRLDIKKNLDVVVLSSNLAREIIGEERPLTCHLLPRGILREPLSSLERADVIFLIKEDESDSEYVDIFAKFNPGAGIIPWNMSVSRVEIEGKVSDLSVLKDKRPFLFASIGSYYRLLRMLKQRDIHFAYHHNFGDHHNYSEKGFRKLKHWSDCHSADCYLTTAKDMVKLPPAGLDKPVYCLQLEVRPDDEQALNDLIGTLD